jgi:hypothetical protein
MARKFLAVFLLFLVQFGIHPPSEDRPKYVILPGL